jgi:SAM-dependent methyltransferase
VRDAYQGFPDGFFDRTDPTPDEQFYDYPRMVTHIDDRAIAAVGALYEELGLCGPESGPVLDLMSSWISHFPRKPASLTVVGMNAAEMAANTMADEASIVDLNESPTVPFPDASFAAAVCCVSVDYLTRPIEVFNEVARVVRPGGAFVCTFSNRCFPTKAIRGWLGTDDETHMTIVTEYFRGSAGWDAPVAQQRTPANHRGDPLYAVWAHRSIAERLPSDWQRGEGRAALLGSRKGRMEPSTPR